MQHHGTCSRPPIGPGTSGSEQHNHDLSSKTSCKGQDLSSKILQTAHLGGQVRLCNAQGILPPAGCPVHGKCSLWLLGAHKQGLCCGPVLMGGCQVALRNVQRPFEARAGVLQGWGA